MAHPLDVNLLLATLVYTGIGVLVFLLAFWLIERITPFSIRKELEEDQNIAVAVVIGSIMLGLAIIISATVG